MPGAHATLAESMPTSYAFASPRGAIVPANVQPPTVAPSSAPSAATVRKVSSAPKPLATVPPYAPATAASEAAFP